MSALSWCWRIPISLGFDRTGPFESTMCPPGTTPSRLGMNRPKLRQVRVGAGGVARESSSLLDARRFKKKPHINKFGKSYKKKRVKY